MKMKLKLLSIILFSTLCFACKEKKNSEEIAILEINAEEATNVILDQIASDIEIIELDIPQGVSLGRIEHIKCCAGQIYIHDMLYSRTITVFKEDGSFIGQLDKTGGGPGEYLGIDAFAVEHNKNNLIVYERERGFYNYSLPDLSFRGFKEEHRYFNNIEIAGDKKLITVTERFERFNHENGIGILDYVTSEYTKLNLPDATAQIELSFANTFTNSPNGKLIYASPGYLVNVFELNSMPPKHLFSIDFGKNKIPEEIWLLEEADDFQRAVMISNTPKALWVQNFLFSDQNAAFFYPFGNPDNTYLAICDLSNIACKSYSGIQFANDLSILPPPIGVSDGYFLSVIYPEMSGDIFPKILNSDYPEWLQQSVSLMKKNKPFLLKYKLI
jgi:hypothetical protein